MTGPMDSMRVMWLKYGFRFDKRVRPSKVHWTGTEIHSSLTTQCGYRIPSYTPLIIGTLIDARRENGESVVYCKRCRKGDIHDCKGDVVQVTSREKRA